MGRRPVARFATVFAASLAGAAPVRAQAVLLRLAPPVGQATHYRTVTRTWVQIPGMTSGDTTEPTMQQTLFSTRSVTGVEGSVRTVTTVVDSSRMEMGPMGGGMPPGDLLRGMTTTQQIDEWGRVLSTQVTPPPGLPPQMAQGISRSGSRSSPAMPDHPVQPGDTWTDSMVASAGEGPGDQVRTVTRLTLKLERVEQAGSAHLATVSLSGTIQSDTTAAAAPGAIFGTMSGEVTVDLSAGRITRSATTIDATVRTPQGTMPMRSNILMEALP
jgi:hypothetical protein